MHNAYFMHHITTCCAKNICNIFFKAGVNKNDTSLSERCGGGVNPLSTTKIDGLKKIIKICILEGFCLILNSFSQNRTF